MVSEPVTRRYASKDAAQMGVDCEIPHWLEGGMAQGGSIVRSHVDGRGERNISYKGVKTSP